VKSLRPKKNQIQNQPKIQIQTQKKVNLLNLCLTQTPGRVFQELVVQETNKVRKNVEEK
jgi:hypothetical protein